MLSSEAIPLPLFPHLSLPLGVAVADCGAFAVSVRLDFHLDPKGRRKRFRAEYFLRRALRQNTPGGQYHNGIAEGGCKIEVVDGGHNAQPVGDSALAQRGHHACLVGNIKVGVRFVQQQRAASLRQRFCNQRTLKFTAGKLSNRFVAQWLKLHQGNGFLGSSKVLLGFEPNGQPAMRQPPYQYQLLDGVAKGWDVVLRNPSNAAGAFGGGIAVQRLAIKQDAAAVAGKDSAQKFQKGGFARSIAANQPNKLAIGGRQCCLLNAKAAAIRKGDIAPRNRHWRRS